MDTFATINLEQRVGKIVQKSLIIQVEAAQNQAGSPAYRAAFDDLKIQGKVQVPENQQEIDEFDFIIPEQTQTTVKAITEYIASKEHLYFKKDDNRLYYNTNLASIIYRNPEHVGNLARAQFGRNNAGATATELEAAYKEAADAAHRA